MIMQKTWSLELMHFRRTFMRISLDTKWISFQQTIPLQPSWEPIGLQSEVHKFKFLAGSYAAWPSRFSRSMYCYWSILRFYIRITSWQHWYSNLESWICNDLWDLYDAACNRRWCQLEYKRRFQMPWKYSEFNQNETFDFHFRREFTKIADVEQERLRPNRSQVQGFPENSQISRFDTWHQKFRIY